MGGATIAGASLVPVAPAFEAASNALKGHEAHALKGASSRNAARVRLRAALESAVKSKAADLDERPSHASPSRKVRADKRTLGPQRFLLTMRSQTIRAGRNCRVLRTALERAPLVGAGLRSCPAPGCGVPLTGRQGAARKRLAERAEGGGVNSGMSAG